MCDTGGIRIIREKMNIELLLTLAGHWFENMVKVVVDIEKEIVGVGGMLHADAEKILLEQGSRQENIWGANIYPFKKSDERIEYSALINIRPGQNNPGMDIRDDAIRRKVRSIIEKLVIGPDEKLV